MSFLLQGLGFIKKKYFNLAKNKLVQMKKKLGIVLSIIFAAVFFGVLIYDAGLKPVLISVGITALIFLAVSLCVYLIID